MAFSQALNALYAHPYDIHNFLSHAYRVVGYVLIYRGIFISEMREPTMPRERMSRHSLCKGLFPVQHEPSQSINRQ